MDELAYALAIDPVELRIRNHAARDEQHDPHQLVGSSALDDRLERPAGSNPGRPTNPQGSVASSSSSCANVSCMASAAPVPAASSASFDG
jgi:hypothetical protein